MMDCGNLQGVISTLQWLRLSETGKLIEKYVSPNGMTGSEVEEILAKAKEEGFELKIFGDTVCVDIGYAGNSFPMIYGEKFDIEDDIARLKNLATEMKNTKREKLEWK